MTKLATKPEQTPKNFCSFMPVAAAEDEELPVEIELLQTGEWNTPNHGRFQVTSDDLVEYVNNFKAGVRKGVPIDLEHVTEGAAGWINDLFVKGNSLWGVIEWTKRGAELLADKMFKFISPTFWPYGYEDPETGEEIENVLVRAALTNTPLFKNLKPLVASDLTRRQTSPIILAEEWGMDLDKLRAKAPEDLDDQEREFLKEHQDELTDEERSKFGLTSDDNQDDQDADNKDDNNDNDSDNQDDADANKSGPVDAADKTVAISASELDLLKKQAADGTKALMQLEHNKAAATVDAWIKTGKVKASEGEGTTNFLLSLTDKQREHFEGMMGKIPENSLVTAGELGKGSKGSIGNAAEQIRELATKKIEANEKLSYGAAVKQVIRENPELAREYAEVKE